MRVFWLAFVFVFCGSVAHAVGIAGTVVDSAGKAVAGATVWLDQDHVVSHRITDNRGGFAFASIPAKPAKLVARKEGLAIGGTFLPAPGIGTVPITLQEPVPFTVNIKTQSQEPIAGALLRHVVINSTVEIECEDLVPDGFPLWVSNAQGIITINEAPKNGRVGFVVGHDDYANRRILHLPVEGSGVDILLTAGIKLRGRVTNPAGKPVANARVSVLQDGRGPQRIAGVAITDKEGFYHFALKPRNYTLAVTHPNYASPKVTPITLEEEGIGNEAGKNIANLVLVKPREVQGYLVYPDGAPCQGISVGYWINNDLYLDTLTQKNGSFRFNVPPEPGKVMIQPPNGFMPAQNEGILVPAGTASNVIIPPIRLEKLPVVEGTLNGTDGNPVANALVTSLNIAPPVLGITDAKGKFHFVLSRPPEGVSIAKFRAEHARRFQRCDFEMDLKNPKPLTLALADFKPDTEPRSLREGTGDLSPLVGKPAPELTCDAWFNSQPLTLASLRGKVVILTFWSGFDATGPGRDRIEELCTFYDIFNEGTDSKDVVFIAVHDSADVAQMVERFTQDFRIPFATAHDKAPSQTTEKYQVIMLPQTFLIDKNGIIRYTEVNGRLFELIKVLREQKI